MDDFEKLRGVDELDPVPAAMLLDLDGSDFPTVSVIAARIRPTAGRSTPVIALVDGKFHDWSRILASMMGTITSLNH